jgi:hypothetical protein
MMRAGAGAGLRYDALAGEYLACAMQLGGAMQGAVGAALMRDAVERLKEAEEGWRVRPAEH